MKDRRRRGRGGGVVAVAALRLLPVQAARAD